MAYQTIITLTLISISRKDIKVALILPVNVSFEGRKYVSWSVTLVGWSKKRNANLRSGA